MSAPSPWSRGRRSSRLRTPVRTRPPAAALRARLAASLMAACGWAGRAAARGRQVRAACGEGSGARARCTHCALARCARPRADHAHARRRSVRNGRLSGWSCTGRARCVWWWLCRSASWPHRARPRDTPCVRRRLQGWQTSWAPRARKPPPSARSGRPPSSAWLRRPPQWPPRSRRCARRTRWRARAASPHASTEPRV
jgi:hypothetical protein